MTQSSLGQRPLGQLCVKQSSWHTCISDALRVDVFMPMALDLARKAAQDERVPVGCVLVDGHTGKVVASASNGRHVLDHAECLALREYVAERGLETSFLSTNAESTPSAGPIVAYVSLEPCMMCLGAMIHAGVRHIFFGAYEPKSGAVESGIVAWGRASGYAWPMAQGGFHQEESAALLKTFFQQRR